MRVSYWVHSENYIGDPAGRGIPSSARRIAPKEHNSYKFIPNTETSWPYNLSLPSKPHFIREPDGKILALRKTSNNTFTANDYDRNHDFSSQIDDGVIRDGYQSTTFDGWKAGSKPPIDHNYVPLPPRTSESMAIGSFEERLAKFTDDHTQLLKYVTDFELRGLRFNEAGPQTTRLGNLEYHIKRGYLKTEEATELVETLKAKGRKPGYIKFIAVGGLPERAIYGVTRSEDGWILFASEDAYDKIARDANQLNLSVYDMMNMDLDEEVIHMRGFLNERGAKEIKLKNLEKLAKNAEGEPKKRWLKERRQKQVRAAEIDIETMYEPERYGRGGLFYKQLYSKDRVALEEILTYKAVEEKGYRGKDVKDYVSKRMNEIREEAEKEGRMSRLEQIVEKDEKAEQKESAKESPAEASE